VKKHGAEHAAKGFACWTQFVAMLFRQLGRADSLREICNGLACCLGRLVHPGIATAPSRSTLSYANEHRPAALFEDLFWTALGRFRDQQGLGSRQHKFRFQNKLLSLDSTTISLCLTMFLGLSSAAPRAASKLTSCSITTITFRRTCYSPRPSGATSSWPILSA
jgi:hypothetical protein